MMDSDCIDSMDKLEAAFREEYSSKDLLNRLPSSSIIEVDRLLEKVDRCHSTELKTVELIKNALVDYKELLVKNYFIIPPKKNQLIFTRSSRGNILGGLLILPSIIERLQQAPKTFLEHPDIRNDFAFNVADNQALLEIYIDLFICIFMKGTVNAAP